MDVASLKAQIQSNQLNPFYIFTGEEWYVQRLYMKQIAKRFNDRLNSVDDAKTLFQQLSKRSVLSQNAVYVLRDDTEIIKNPEIIDTLKSVIAENIVILVLSSVDKRTKLYKTYKDTFIEFHALEHALLKRHIMREIALSDRCADKLIDLCESNYGRCLLEIDKIKQLMSWNTMSNISADDCFKVLLEEKIIYQPPYDAIFNFVDEVLLHHVNSAYDALDNCKKIGESSLAILTVLYNNAKQVLQVQSYDGNELMKATGLTQFQISCAKKRCNVYRTGDLVYMLQLIHEIEVGIKLGTISESIAIDYLLVNIL